MLTLRCTTGAGLKLISEWLTLVDNLGRAVVLPETVLKISLLFTHIKKKFGNADLIISFQLKLLRVCTVIPFQLNPPN